MHYTIEETAKVVGLSVPQTRRRLHTMETDLDGDLHRGSRGKVLLTDRGLAILRRAVEIEHDHGLGCHDAAKVVREETANPQGDGSNATVTVRDSSGMVAELMGELRARIQFLERENSRLWGLVDDLKALPAPKEEEPRRPWIVRLLRPLLATRG